MLTHLSLFSGIGGLDLAAEWAGFKTVGQCEWADYPTKILEKHWPEVERWRDIHDLSANEFFKRTGIRKGELTCISGGFPCQPHALCGKRLASNDKRDLWGEYFRVVREIKPKWIVAENVRGLLSSENGRFFGRVLRDLAQCGYSTWWYCFPAAATGTVFQGYRVAIVSAASCFGRDCVDANKKVRPDEHYTKGLEEWRTRQDGVLSSIIRPHTEPKCRYMRNDDGISEQMDRFKCIGNSVVPQQFYPIFKAIFEIENSGKEAGNDKL